MFDIGWQELFIVAILALIVVGPKDLPRALRTVMGLVRKARMMASDFQNGIDDVVREADLDDMKNQLESLSDGDINKQIHRAIDPSGDLANNLGMTEIHEELNEIVNEKPKVSDVPPLGSTSDIINGEVKVPQPTSVKDT